MSKKGIWFIKSHWKGQRSCNIGGFLEWIIFTLVHSSLPEIIWKSKNMQMTHSSEYCSEKMWHFATFCIALVRLVFHFVFFMSHQLRLVLNIYEGVLVVLHGEAESNWPEWWVTAVWLSHRPLFSWILGRRFEINWAFVKYLNITNNKSFYILVGFNFLFQSQKSVFHLHLADHCDLVCPGLSDDFFKHSRCEMLSTIFHIVKMKKWNKTKTIV